MIQYQLIDPFEQIDSPNFNFVESFLLQTRRTQIGWHYLTDLIWIYSHVGEWPKNVKIIDIGGGSGPLQFFLAELGFEVNNIDLCINQPKIEYLKRYKMSYKELSSWYSSSYEEHYDSFRAKSILSNSMKKCIKKNYLYQLFVEKYYKFLHDKWRKNNGFQNRAVGKINWIKGNLCNIPEIEDDSYDGVVSLSALEHIPIESLPIALNELQRVLKPNYRCAITTSATEKNKTWFHNPSQGYCYSINDLMKYFGINDNGPSDPYEILNKYKQCDYLRKNLAKFYFKSKNNGMPLGKWYPSYIPVGIYN